MNRKKMFIAFGGVAIAFLLLFLEFGLLMWLGTHPEYHVAWIENTLILFIISKTIAVPMLCAYGMKQFETTPA